METACKGKSSECSLERTKEILYECVEGTIYNNIFVKELCAKGCQDGGSGNSDVCIK
jgi:hypothetical protein